MSCPYGVEPDYKCCDTCGHKFIAVSLVEETTCPYCKDTGKWICLGCGTTSDQPKDCLGCWLPYTPYVED